MRGTLRLLASVKPVRYLETGAPTGLAGLFTNASPRATLLYLYSSTLDKLQAVPETSLYRQSVEAVTKHRMSLVEAVKPEGYDAWHARAQAILQKHPDHFDQVARPIGDGSQAAGVTRNGQFFVVRNAKPVLDERYEEWDGEEDTGPELEGTRTTEDRKDQVRLFKDVFSGKDVEWEDEPRLTADQYVEPIRNKGETEREGTVPPPPSVSWRSTTEANVKTIYTGLRSSRTRSEQASSRRLFRSPRESFNWSTQ